MWLLYCIVCVVLQGNPLIAGKIMYRKAIMYALSRESCGARLLMVIRQRREVLFIVYVSMGAPVEPYW